MKTRFKLLALGAVLTVLALAKPTPAAAWCIITERIAEDEAHCAALCTGCNYWYDGGSSCVCY